jgi:hypothetical protein
MHRHLNDERCPFSKYCCLPDAYIAANIIVLVRIISHKEAAANARAQLEKERNGIEQSLSDIVDVQVPTLQH